MNDLVYNPAPHYGAVAQLGEHCLCKAGVVGSIPIRSTYKSTVKTVLFYLPIFYHS